MRTKDILIIGGVGLLAYYLINKQKTQQQQQQQQSGWIKDFTGLYTIGSDLYHRAGTLFG